MTENENENQPGYVRNFWVDELDYTANDWNETRI
jgi:hypothetical protein